MTFEKELLTGNAAVATAVRLAGVEYIPAYPITPQTEIIELLSKWIDEGKMQSRIVLMDSEHSMMSAAGAAAVTGVRTFTASSSQGLLYAFEMLYNVAGWRAPIVLANVSRALAAPITLEPDHNDVLSARDSGFIQIHCETCQEVIDSILMAYRIAEDGRVRLPAIVNLDGFYLSYTREPVQVPDQKLVEEFLPEYSPPEGYICASNPMSVASAVLDGRAYSYFKYQMHLASLNALEVHERAASDFERLFGRKYGLAEEFMLQDADYVLVTTNSFSTMAKAAAVDLRKAGKKVGILRIRMVRPFPRAAIARMLAGKKGVAVFDQNISVGSGGILYPEILAALYHQSDRPKRILSFIGGLGRKRLSSAEFRHMLSAVASEAEQDYLHMQSVLLFTDQDWGSVKGMLRIAGKAVPEETKEDAH